MSETPSKLVVHVDGGARGNPGPAAIGVVVSLPGGEVVEEVAERIGVATNNVAEYQALLRGLERAAAQGAGEVEIVNDSELVARQVNGVYKVKHPAMRPLYLDTLEALRNFERWQLRNVPRAENARADALVNAALDARVTRFARTDTGSARKMSVTQAARQLVGQQHEHRVVSLYLDLDPERFATAPARASQIHSLLDGARRQVERDDSLDHQELMALREDLDRVDAYLASGDAPFKRARALAIFCSLRDDLFEVVQLSRPTEGQVVIERTPYIEPLIRGAQDRRWCVTLVSSRAARVLVGLGDRLEERQRIEDNVQGQHRSSQSEHERSVDKEVDDHLRRVAEMLYRRWRREPFDRLALGGPVEVTARLEHFLHEELRLILSDRRVDVDVANTNEIGVTAAVAKLVEEDDRERERAALDRLAGGVGSGGRAAGGLEDTLRALGERRVELLLLAPDFAGSGARCPECGLLYPGQSGSCAADGSVLTPVERLPEALIESALTQDAEILIVRHLSELGPFGGVGVLLRF